MPERIVEVVYENLVANPDEEIRALLDRCGLEFDDACLEFHADAGVVTTASYVQARRPIYKTSVSRSSRYRRQLKPLVDVLASRNTIATS